MRLAVMLAAGAAGVSAGVVPALATGELRAAVTTTVSADNFAFSPASVEIAVGDTVKWVEGSGSHTVKFGTQDNDIGDAGFERTFNADATVSYVCGIHDKSMTGTVKVGSGGTTTTGTTTTQTSTTQTTTTGTTTTQTTTTGTTTTTQTTTTGTTTQPGGGGTPTAVAKLAPRATRTSFCVRRGRRCPKPGIEIRLRAPARGTVTGVLRRDGASKAFGTVALPVVSGLQRVRFTAVRGGRRPSPGRYRLTLRFKGWPSDTPSETVRFRVR